MHQLTTFLSLQSSKDADASNYFIDLPSRKLRSNTIRSTSEQSIQSTFSTKTEPIKTIRKVSWANSECDDEIVNKDGSSTWRQFLSTTFGSSDIIGKPRSVTASTSNSSAQFILSDKGSTASNKKTSGLAYIR
jgi:hypothetical protein